MARKPHKLSDTDAAGMGQSESTKVSIKVVADGRTPGFVLMVTPIDQTSDHVIVGRKAPRQAFMMGSNGELWASEPARPGAVDEARQVENGFRPVAQHHANQHQGNSRTVNELCDRYLSEGHLQKQDKTQRSWDNDRSNITNHIRPKLGALTLVELTKPMLERFKHDVATGQGKVASSRTKGGRAIAARCMSTLGAMLNWGVDLGLIAENATQGIERIKLDGRERFLTMPEIRRLGAALHEREQAGENVYAIAALRLLILTGARRGEILGLQWDWIDFEHGLARLPYSKTGAKILPLGHEAIRLLLSLPRLTGSPYVLPRRGGLKPLREIYFVWNRVRKVAGLEGVRIHDLRHSFASAAVSDGTSLYMVAKLLGHRQAATTQRYAHLHDDPVREAANRISGRIAAALAGIVGS